MGKNFVIIIVTCGSKPEAQKIADSLLKKKLTACANIIPGVSSRFWWRGSLDNAAETILMLKTLKSKFRKIESVIKQLHSYDVPEIIAIPIAAGSKDYLDWIKKSVKGP